MSLNILVTMPDDDIRHGFIPAETADKLGAMGNVIWNSSEESFSEAELREKIKGIDMCITGWGCTRISGTVIENADRLKVILHTGGTVAPYVCEEVFKQGIRVISGNELYAESVAEGALAYILCALRGLVHANQLVQMGEWKPSISESEGLLDKDVGLVGYGAIARYLITFLKPFRCRVKLYSRHMSEEECAGLGVEKSTLEEIFSSCRVISLHSALTDKTYHMIGEGLLALIQESAVLVNTARGGVIDEKALEKELARGRFKAILDVFEQEPLPAESKLRGLDNCILIPHMGGPTPDRWKMITEALLCDAENYFSGGKLKYEISRQYAGNMTSNG